MDASSADQHLLRSLAEASSTKIRLDKNCGLFKIKKSTPPSTSKISFVRGISFITHTILSLPFTITHPKKLRSCENTRLSTRSFLVFF